VSGCDKPCCATLDRAPVSEETGGFSKVMDRDDISITNGTYNVT